mmetsp:Transcript_11063/g.21162  ORF Transcript_11063/g.21162 Transcript_11063/m.21162 type:complete len:565 (-) Transcript_11063:77-1771(-)
MTRSVVLQYGDRRCVASPFTPAETTAIRRRPRGWLGRTLGPIGQGSMRACISTLMGAAIGPGALLLPYAIRLLGIPLGLVGLLFGSYCSAQSLRFIMTISHVTGCDSYNAGMVAVLGRRAGSLAFSTCFFVLVMSISAHLKFMAGIIAQLFTSMLGEPGNGDGRCMTLVLFIMLPNCVHGSLGALQRATIVAPVGLLSVIGLLLFHGLSQQSQARLGTLQGSSTIPRFGTNGVWGCVEGWSIIVNAFALHHVAVPVHKQLDRNHAQRVNKVVYRATLYTGFLYALLGCGGFLAHGDATPENVLWAYPRDDQAAMLARALLGCSLLVTVPLNVRCLSEQILESALSGALEFPGKRYMVSALCLILPAALSSLFSSVSSIVGIACGFGLVIYIFILPSAAMCTLCWTSSVSAPAVRRELTRKESLHDLLLSSPLSSPLLMSAQSTGTASLSGMVSPRMHSPLLAPSSISAVEDLQLPNLALNIDMKDSMPHDGVSRCSSLSSQEGRDDVVFSQWSSEFAFTLLALALASLFGAAWAMKTLLQTLSSAFDIGLNQTGVETTMLKIRL